MTEIIQREDPLLRKIAEAVPLRDIGTKRLNGIIGDLKDALGQQSDGIAIAAPQIGVLLQIFIVSGALLKQADKKYSGPESYLVFINPKITKLSREKTEMEEGCLSVRWLYGKVKRSTRATVLSHNEKGERVERGASGILAQIFQHEVDHLNGILFMDKASEVWEMSESEVAKMQRM